MSAVAAAPSVAKKEIRLNAFSMNCVGHINHGLWTHPRDQSYRYTDIDYWTDLAQTLERGKFDGLFLADIIGVYDVYQSSLDLTAREAIQLPVNDPALLVSAMAHATQHLGFGITTNLIYEQPFIFARRMSTLDHLSRGRIGWNIVTGYLDSAARAAGLSQQLTHDRRYDQADEFMEVCYRLWEGSWEQDAVRNDRQQRIYASPEKIHKIQHHGDYYHVEAVHLSEPSPQRTPVLFQAGSSGRGLLFAARHAECIFISSQTVEGAAALVRTVRAEAVRAGRRADDIKVFMGLTVVVGETAALAQAKYADYLRYASPEAGLAHYASGTGIDFSRYALDQPISTATPGTEAMKSQSGIVTDPSLQWTKRKLLEQLALGGRYPVLVGTPQQVADAMQQWMDDTDIDGFNLTRVVNPESYVDFIDLVVPELQRRGVFKLDYAKGTLREKLGGEALLPARHAAASFRYGAAQPAQPAKSALPA